MVRTNVLDDKKYWYKDAVIYELHIKAFFDSNGDGMGDFAGLIKKLDYLQDLGITAIWVLPFYPSPLRDDGYDIADYYSINSHYGNLEEFQQFLAEAHRRNLKVITELVINHTSDQHPWFQRARKAPLGSPEREYYVWSDDPKKYEDVRIIFQDFEASNWTWDPVAQQYYWHRFFHHQPDLNFDSELVQKEIFQIIDYWCAMGVDGFRLDAVPYLYERENTNGENLPETHAFLKKLRKHIDERYPASCFLAEANMWPEDSASYFGNGDECHMNYHFPVMPRMFMALQREDRYPITDIFDQTPPIPETCQWAIFLRNHDELTLEMVTDEERDYMYKVYAKDPKAKINLGIRHRLAPLMENDRRRIELMNSLLFSLPGTPVIYYGDEIGMGDNFYLGDRDGVRTPMQWSPDRNAGFSETNPQRLYLPVILDPQYHYETVNVETQRANTSSLFWFMKRMINMRKKYKAFSRGNMKFFPVDNAKILAFTRSYEEETLLVIVNLSKYSQPAEIDIKSFKGYMPVEAFSKNTFPAIREDSPYFFTMSPYAYHWFVLQKPATEVSAATKFVLEVSNWDSLFFNEAADLFQTIILPGYMRRMHWFTGKDKNIYSINIIEHTGLPLKNKEVEILLIEVVFESGLPEYYQLPVAFVGEEEAKNLAADTSTTVISELKLNNEVGFLVDAVYTSLFATEVFNFLANGKRFMSGGEVVFTSDSEMLKHFQNTEHLTTRVSLISEMHTGIAYDNQFFLKLYRKVDKGIHPDVEIVRFLSGSNVHISKYSGAIEWHLHDSTFVLGMLEKLEENRGNGHQYMQERLANFLERILARDRTILSAYPKMGSLTNPISFEELNFELKEFIGGNASEMVRQIGLRLAEVHKELAHGIDKDFLPEEFSLHYQRSLFSSMSSLVRAMGEAIDKRINTLPNEMVHQVNALNNKKEQLLTTLRRIYSKKFDVLKIRIHGNLVLSHILLTGKDIILHDFGGNPLQPFSERRLKRSPLRDVAAMIRSFYYVAYEEFLSSPQIHKEEQNALFSFADFWAHHMSMFFMEAYLAEIKYSGFIPDDEDDFEILMETYLLENALHWFNYELIHRPKRAIIPLRIIQMIIK